MGGRRISELFYELRANTEGLKRDLDDGQRQLGKFSQFVERNPTAVVGALGVALAGVGIEAVHMAERSEGALRRIAVNIPNGIRGAEQLRASLKGVTEESGRSREETLALFEAISKQGVTSAAEIETRALAIQKFADATNASTEATAAGLDQLMDAFGITADGAELALAKIASVAKGRAAVEDVLEALQAAAPTIAKFGLDFDTSIRALTQLMDGYGLSAGQAGKKLKSLDATDIRALAKDAHIAADALQDLNDRANLVRDGADRASQKLKNDFSETMERLGVRILPVVNAELQGLLGLLDQLTQHDTDLSGAEATINAAAARAKRVRLNDQNLDSVRGALGQVIGGAGITAQFTYEKATELPKESAEALRKGLEILLQYRKEAGLTAGQVANVTANIETLDLALLKYATTAAKAGSVTGGTAGGGTRKVLPLTIEEKAAATAAILDVEKSVTEFGVMVQKTIAGTTKSAVDNAIAEYQALGVKIQEVRATIAKKATVRGVDSGELQAQRAQLDQFAQQALAAQRGDHPARHARGAHGDRRQRRGRAGLGDRFSCGGGAPGGRATDARAPDAGRGQQGAHRAGEAALCNADRARRSARPRERRSDRRLRARRGDRAPARHVGGSRTAALERRPRRAERRGAQCGAADARARGEGAHQLAGLSRLPEADPRPRGAAAPGARSHRRRECQGHEGRGAADAPDRRAGARAAAGDGRRRAARGSLRARRSRGRRRAALRRPDRGGDRAAREHAGQLPLGRARRRRQPTGDAVDRHRRGTAHRRRPRDAHHGDRGLRKNEALERNTDAIRELTKKAGLIGESVLGGRAGLTAVDIAERLKATPGFEDLKGSKAFPARVNGLTNEQLAIFKKAAADLGVAIDYSGQSWRDAANAILEAASKLGEFGNDWASQQQMYDARRKIFGEDTPDVRLNQIRAAATAASPALKGLFEAIDLTDPASLEVLRQRVKTSSP
jgi:hypothetical protein